MARDRCRRRGGVITLIVTALALNCVVSRAAAAAAPQLPRGTPDQVVLTHYSPLFSNAEIVRRLLSPLARKEVHDSLTRELATLTPYSIDLSKENFLVYVPSRAPPSPRGFALLVWVPPWNEARLPFGWASQLDHYGVIFVAPGQAGNTANVLSRRVPLALSAEENLIREYPIDRERIFVGGFSGGSRVALRIALGYPDVFHGALLHAGSNPLGEGFPLPPRDLFQRFQRSSHLVYFTGATDTYHLSNDASSSASMQQWCVFNVETHEVPDEGHEQMSATVFGRALDRLLSPVSPDPARLSACRSRIAAELHDKLSQAQALISNGGGAAARQLLLDIDKQYGGLAAPRILELAQKCGCGLASSAAAAPGEPAGAARAVRAR
jgi:pimeloyl-ACP methyl ester carboxylesterase